MAWNQKEAGTQEFLPESPEMRYRLSFAFVKGVIEVTLFLQFLEMSVLEDQTSEHLVLQQDENRTNVVKHIPITQTKQKQKSLVLYLETSPIFNFALWLRLIFFTSCWLTMYPDYLLTHFNIFQKFLKRNKQ